MSDNIHFTKGDVQESLSIMKEAAIWLEKAGKRLWFPDDITRNKIKHIEDDFVVLWKNNITVATMLLSYEDLFFWSDVAKNSSAFIHKLSVKREYAGLGYADKMIEYAIDDCRNRELAYLRLDCDAKRKKLCEFYERMGFNLNSTINFDSVKYGKLIIALYEIDMKNYNYR